MSAGGGNDVYGERGYESYSRVRGYMLLILDGITGFISHRLK